MPMAKHTSPRQMRGSTSALMRSLRVLDQHRPALAVGDEVQAHRRVGDAEFLGDDVALEEAALAPAVFLGPGHADPALGADLAAELLAVGPSIVAGSCGSKVPAAISLARKARTSSRSASHSGGRRIGSKVSSVAMCRLLTAPPACGHRPSAPLAATSVAELHRPGALVAEVVAPGPQPPREAMQHVLLREADGAQHLMRDGGALAWPPRRRGSWRRPLRGRRASSNGRLRGIGDGIGGRAGGGHGDGHLAGEPREVVLHGLELGDRALEGDALVGVGDGEVEDRLQRARHLHGAHGGAHQQQGLLVEAGGRVLDGDGRTASKLHRVERIAADAGAVGDAGLAKLDERDGPPPPSSRRASTARCLASLAKGTRSAARPLKVPLAAKRELIAVARRRAGHGIPWARQCRPRDSSQPASSVSASGSGTAKRPASRSTAKPSGEAGAGAAQVFRHPGQRQPGLFQRGPGRRLPGVAGALLTVCGSQRSRRMRARPSRRSGSCSPCFRPPRAISEQALAAARRNVNCAPQHPQPWIAACRRAKRF